MGERLRLDKYLADVSLGTRSEIKAAIRKGRVSVNGITVRTPEQKVDCTVDQVSFDGQKISYASMEYYLLNKPSGVVSATSDKKETTVIELIQSRVRKDLFPVGRLDKDTEGLLLITNDGVLAHNLLSPKKHVSKVYFAKIKGTVTKEDERKFEEGLAVDDTFTALPAKLKLNKTWTEENEEYSEIELTIWEGKFHQVKRMFASVGKEVIYLKRIAMGPLVLPDNLPFGSYRKLTAKELEALNQCANGIEFPL